MILYKLTFSTGKSYIGQTQRDLETRMRNHFQNVKHGSALAVHCAWRKYGDPLVEVIGEYPDAASLHDAEIEAIKTFGTLSPCGYNIGYGGETAPSKNPIVAAKIAEKATGRIQSAETRAIAAKAMTDRMADPEYRAKMAEANRNYWTPERRLERAESSRLRATGVKFTEDRRRKISESKKVISAETRAKMSAAAKRRGRNNDFSEETRAKLGENIKASWSNPEIRERRLTAMKAAHAERRAKRMQENTA